MTWLEAIILGLVEGITEYLPVSSTGHLRLAQQAMHIADGDASRAYAICIQAGAIVAVLGLYWRRVRQMGMGLLGRDDQGRRLLACVVAGFAPAAGCGLLLEKRIDALLSNLWFTVAAWFVGGVAILLVAKRRHSSPPSQGAAGVGSSRRSTAGAPTSSEDHFEVDSSARSDSADASAATLPQPLAERDRYQGARSAAPRHAGLDLPQLTWQLALIIGLAQCIAMWPGVSRSLVTIVAGLLVGLRLAAAVEFSFILGVVTLSAASAYKGFKYHQTLIDHYTPLAMFLGFFFAFLSAVVAVKWMVAYLNKHGLAIFGWYRVTIAIIVASLLLAKVLQA